MRPQAKCVSLLFFYLCDPLSLDFPVPLWRPIRLRKETFYSLFNTA